MKAIKYYDLTRLKKMGFLEYAENFMKLAGQCPTVVSKMQRTYNPLKVAYDYMQEINYRVDKSDLTDPIHLLDAQQDGLYTALWHAANSLRKSNGEKGEQALSLWNTMNSKRVHTNIQYLQELAEVDRLIAVLDRDQLENIEALGLKPIYDQMKEMNAEIHRLIDERGDENIEKPDGKFSLARTDFTKKYDSFVYFVNAYHLINVEDAEQPDEALDRFILKVNEKIKLFEDTQRPTTGSASSGGNGGGNGDGEEDGDGENGGEDGNPNNPSSPSDPNNPNNPNNPSNPGTGSGNDNQEPTLVTMLYLYHDNTEDTRRGEPGTRLVSPEPDAGYEWQPTPPNVFPDTDRTFTEVEIEDNGEGDGDDDAGFGR